MNKTLATVIGIIIILGLGLLLLSKKQDYFPRACTLEAKICPDGSAVGRTGPNCEFTECPANPPEGGGGGILPYDSGVSGQVLLGPICPVESYPPDPNCAAKGYETTIQVIAVGSPKSSPFTTAKTDKDGRFKITLPPGDYTLQPIGAKVFPSCSSVNITVKPATILQVNLSCDTGIR